MADLSRVHRVLSAYPDDCQPRAVEWLGSAGGFSGAVFWRIITRRGTLCLRRWPPEHPTRERLDFIHAVLRHVEAQGYHLIPVPLSTRDHASYVANDDSLWELATWVPGEANYRRAPTRQKLAAALAALAGFHQAAATFPTRPPRPAQSPGILERLKQLEALQAGGIQEIHAAIEPRPWPGLVPRAQELCQRFSQLADDVATRLRSVADVEVSLQPCLRDIWSDHVIFAGEQVSGLVDFGAMRQESVAADVGRLLGSMAEDDQAAWRAGLEAYQTVAPLCAGAQRLAETFDRSGTLLSAVHWMKWIYLDGRTFTDRDAVLDRIDRLLARLAHHGRDVTIAQPGPRPHTM
jgi:homoserine kinase type II